MKKVLFIALLFILSGTLAFAQKGDQAKKLTAEERVEKRIDRLDKSLDLTPEQEKLLKKDLLRIELARDEARAASMEQRQQQKALREEERVLLNNTLTEDQRKKHEAMQQERAQQMKKRKALPEAPAQKQGE